MILILSCDILILKFPIDWVPFREGLLVSDDVIGGTKCISFSAIKKFVLNDVVDPMM